MIIRDDIEMLSTSNLTSDFSFSKLNSLAPVSMTVLDNISRSLREKVLMVSKFVARELKSELLYSKIELEILN